MVLNQSTQKNVNFSQFCIYHNFDPYKVGQLCQLVTKRAKAALRDASVQHTDESMGIADRKDAVLIKKIQDLGKDLGLDITFPSCYAHVTKEQQRQSVAYNMTINLPL